MKKLSFVFAAALALAPCIVSTQALAESATNADAAAAANTAAAAASPAAATLAPALAGTGGAYAVAMVTVSDTSWAAIRYEVNTGKAWKLETGSWRAIADTAELPSSQYRVDMVPLKNDWGAIRVDVRSGRSWSASPEGWVEIAETH